MSPDRKPSRRVVLRGHHRPHGRVHYFSEGKEIPPPTSLEVVRTSAGDACHMLYIGPGEELLTESWHPTVDAALYHAKWEYGIRPEEWENLEPSVG